MRKERVFVCPECYALSNYWSYRGWAREYGKVYVNEDFEPVEFDSIYDDTEFYCPECTSEIDYYEALVDIEFSEGNVYITIRADFDEQKLVDALKKWFTLDGKIYIDGELFKDEGRKKGKPALWSW